MQGDFSGEWDPAKELPAGFVELPGKVYSEYPDWIPEVEAVVRYMFSQQNKYFAVGKVWVGLNDNTRLAGFLAPHQRIEGKLAAFFGYWETKDNPAANKALFEAFEEWARDQGAERIYGPINFSTYGMYRIRLDSFDAGQFIGEPFNPPYYPGLLEGLGYELAKMYGTSNIPDLAKAAEKSREYVDSLKQAVESEYVVKLVTAEYWLDRIEELYGLTLEIFEENFAYTPITLDDFRKACGESFAAKICQHSSVVAETRDGEIAGMMLCFPDYSALVRQGTRQPIAPETVSFAKHFDSLPDPRTLLLKTAGVSDRHRGKYLYTYLFNLCVLNALPYYDKALGCLYVIDNPSRKTADRMSQDLRHYALYSKEL
ncbi:MAG: hypothetical protein R3208_12355 [Ketobacteraceae bacterium]|nr:hypothetical protein [Ketobacteraceae bacterium]